MTINKQALRLTAEKAQEHGVFNMDIHSETVLALLDELEATEKRIAEQREYYEGVIADGSRRIAGLEALTSGMEQEPVAYMTYKGYLLHAADPKLAEYSEPTPLYAAPQLPQPEALSVPDERAAFETFMEKRFKDCIDRRLVKNGDGEYFAWDMQVAWITWQGRATMFQVGNHTEQHLDMVNSPVIAKAYDIEAFGVFSATEGENGLLLQIEQFWFGTENCPQIGKENMVPKFALQAIINRLQAHCDGMNGATLIDILSTPAAPRQEVKP